MTAHWWFILRTKPKSAYEDMWIYYTIEVVKLLHVSMVYRDRELLLEWYITKNIKTSLKIQNIKFYT
jgi:hypothetical protein